MAEKPSDQTFRESTRAPVRAEVRLQFPNSESFEGSSGNVSRGGLFVATPRPQPVGTLIRLELDLPGASETVRGFGEVVWIRVREASPSRPAGMGVQFRHLEPPGEEVLTKHLNLAESLLGERESEEEGAARRGKKEPEPEATEGGEEGGGLAGLGAAPPGGPPAAPAYRPPSAGGGHEASPPGPAPAGADVAPTVFSRRTHRTADLSPEEFLASLPEPEVRRGPPRVPLLVLALVVVLAVAAYLTRGTVARWLGGGEEVQAAAPEEAVPPVAEPAAGGEAPEGEGKGGAGPGGEAVAAGTEGGPEAGVQRPGAEVGGAEVGSAQPPGTASRIPGAGGAAAAPSGPLSRIEDISWWAVEGETIVVLTGDGAIAGEDVDRQHLGGDRPREVLRISGVTEPYKEAVIAVHSPELVRIRTGHHPDVGQLFVVFDLPDAAAAVVRMEDLPSGLRIYLRRQ